jgi:hypothetical protein
MPLHPDMRALMLTLVTSGMKVEREACAKIADDLRDTFKAEIVERARDEDADKLIADYAGATGTAEMISKQIRARSEEKSGHGENE